MSTIHTFRRFAIRTAAVLVLAVPSLSFAAHRNSDSPSASSATHLPAPGSHEAWKMAKFPWLYAPRSSVVAEPRHFPEPGSVEAVMMWKTPYLAHQPASVAPSSDGDKRWPEPGSAEAVKFYKTPYLIDRRPAVEPLK